MIGGFGGELGRLVGVRLGRGYKVSDGKAY